MNIIKNRYLYFLISLIVIIPGIVFMALHWASTKQGPLPLGIDFRGGSLLEIHLQARVRTQLKLPPFTINWPPLTNPFQIR